MPLGAATPSLTTHARFRDEDRVGGRRHGLIPARRAAVTVASGRRTAARTARLHAVSDSTVGRILAGADAGADTTPSRVLATRPTSSTPRKTPGPWPAAPCRCAVRRPGATRAGPQAPGRVADWNSIW